MIRKVSLSLGSGLRMEKEEGCSSGMVQRVSVGESTLDGSNDTFGTDAKHVQKLLWFAALGNTAHGQPVHHNARLFTYCRQDSLAQTTYNESKGTNIKYLTALEETKKVTGRGGWGVNLK